MITSIDSSLLTYLGAGGAAVASVPVVFFGTTVGAIVSTILKTNWFWVFKLLTSISSHW